MKRRISPIIFTCALVLAQSLPAFAQADAATATMKGTVVDQNGAVVAGASLTVKSLDKGISRRVRTDLEGSYQIPLLQPGAYELRVEATGFETKVVKSIELTVGQVLVYDVQLRVGSLASEVVVTSDAPVIEVERTQQANTINKIQVENLPNIGRDFTAYVFTLPGVSSSNAPRAQNPGFTFGSSGFSIGGSNGRNNLVTLDGGENEYGSGQLRTNISVEAIQEFQVNRNAFAAEYGFTTGTAINVVSKGGTNELHGSGYLFYRSQKTSARNFFNIGPKKAFDQRVFPGGTLGGPIKKNKAFFFTSYEHLKSDSARFRSYTDSPLVQRPTDAQLAYLSLLAASTNPNIQRIGANLRAALTTTNYPSSMKLLRENEGNINAPDRLNSWTTRLDYQISNKNYLTGRFSLTHNDTDNLLESNTGAPSASTVLIYRDYTAVGSWGHTFSPSVLNQLRVQFVPNNSARTVPKAPESTSLLIQGLGNFGRDFAAPFNTFQDRYQFEDTLSVATGKHNFKFGTSYRPVNYRVINELWFSGEWNFSSGIFPVILAVPPADRLAFVLFNRGLGNNPDGTRKVPDNGPVLANLSSIQSLNLGLPFLYRQGFGNPEWKDWAHYLGTFAQDSWKITPRLTLDYGMRVDYDAEPAPLNKKAYVSPRVGLAWDPFGDRKTVIRAGGGLFYSPIYYQVVYVTNLLNDSGRFINQIFKTPLDGAQAPAAIWAAGAALGKLPFKALSEADLKALGINTGPRNSGRVVFDVDPNYENPYSIQGSLGITREIANNLSLDVAYQVYRGVHIQVSHEVNYKETGVVDPAFGPQFTRIDPTITQKNIYKSIGNSIYHGMTVSLRKRYSSNFQFEANYTFSKAIDDQTDFNSAFAAFIPTRLDLERAVSAFDVPHIFTANAVIRIPFKSGPNSNILARALADVTISPIVFARSGIPFTLRIGTDVNGDTHALYDRPFRASRNTGRGDNFVSANLRVSKQFYVNRDRGVRIEFISEASNLFNRVNFTSVNDVIGRTSPLLFGPFKQHGSKDIPRTSPLGFTSAAPGRQIQFGLKMAF
ncbi:MAG TPA: TonB-dependent receptor [Blastocatellia bacterium]|nr:TonB-dependent receptor [Blastocatellia bacterium]